MVQEKISKKGILASAGLIVLAITIGFIIPIVRASNNTELSQTINGGTLTADTKDSNRVAVSNPSFTMGATSLSFDCQTTSGTIGSNSQRLYVDNPDVADAGWTLTVAATSGTTALWKNAGNTQSYDFNDSTSSGCSDGVDADSKGGRMTIDPSVGVLSADCSSCSTSNITKGSSASFDQGVTDSITLLNAASGSDDIGRWYLTGVNVNQTVPAEQAADAYTVNLTVTVTAS
jgi:hypothetical protein